MKPRVFLHHATNTPIGRIEFWECCITSVWASVYGHGRTPELAYLDWLKKGGSGRVELSPELRKLLVCDGVTFIPGIGGKA